MKNMSTEEKNIYEILNYNCLLYCKRIIFKYKGRYFYKSSGVNSNISGMILEKLN